MIRHIKVPDINKLSQPQFIQYIPEHSVARNQRAYKSCDVLSWAMRIF